MVVNAKPNSYCSEIFELLMMGQQHQTCYKIMFRNNDTAVEHTSYSFFSFNFYDLVNLSSWPTFIS